MNTASRLACAVVLAALATVSTATAGTAKGPTDVDVSGPGVDRELSYTVGHERSGDFHVYDLSEAARLHHAFARSRLEWSSGLTPEELGPRYVLTWSVGSQTLFVQHAYPFAEGGAWVHFMWEGTRPLGRWLRAPAVTEPLVELGAVNEAPDPALATAGPTEEPTTAAAEPGRSDEDAGAPYDVAVPVGVGIAVVVGVLMLWRRRLSW